MPRCCRSFYSVEWLGRRDLRRSAMRFLKEDPWARLAGACAQAMPKSAAADAAALGERRGLHQLSDNVVRHFVAQAAGAGVDVFSRVRLPELGAEHEGGDRRRVRATDPPVRSGHLLHGKSVRSARDQVRPESTTSSSPRSCRPWRAHVLAIKDMAGLCQPAGPASVPGQGAQGGGGVADSFPHPRYQRPLPLPACWPAVEAGGGCR